EPPSYESATAMMPSVSSTHAAPPEPPIYAEEGRTTAMPAYSDPETPAANADLPTSAMPAYGGGGWSPVPAKPPARRAAPPAQPATPPTRAPEPVRPAEPAPLAPTDEHESHTMILSSLPSIRSSTRLVVIDGPVHGRQFSLGRQLTTIGRSIGCHVTV